MNRFLAQSIDYASQCSYLDDLFQVYPTAPNGLRALNEQIWNNVEYAYNERNNEELIRSLLKLDLFPIKDSYIAYLKHDKNAIGRNPDTIHRIASEIYNLSIGELYKKCTFPKESNRQIGPMFKNWIKYTSFGFPVFNMDDFNSTNKDAILYANDKEMKDFANKVLGYNHDKGLDFIARIKNKYVIGEAKFLTDFGGHQNAQFNDAIATIESSVNSNVIKIAILDGVLYIKSNNKMYKDITTKYQDYNIMSALMLKTFLYTIR